MAARRTIALAIGQLMALGLAAVLIFTAAVDLPDGSSTPHPGPSSRSTSQQRDIAAHRP